MATTSRLQAKLSEESQNNANPWSSLEAAVELLTEAVSGGIPEWDNRAFTYVGATNNVSTVVYKLGASTVATVTYTYVASGVADDDDVLTETLTLA